MAFEQAMLRTFRALETSPKRVLVACSGGVDSMVLLEVLSRLKNVLELEIVVAHVHHGPGNTRYRTKAWKAVQKVALEKDLPFISNSSNGKSANDQMLTSEAELRTLRWQCLRQWQSQFDCDWIAVAHHYQDLLETRLMRLIRGTGVIGLKGMSMVETRETILRPLLMLEKTRVRDYARARDREVLFVEDPSNKKLDAFRNWIRRWLDQLDQRQPNGARNLARSLSQLVEHLERHSEPSQFETALTDGGIDRRSYLQSVKGHQRAHLARYCHQVGIRDYTHGHIEELWKRLDVAKKSFTFEMLQCVWSVTPERIKASRTTGRV